MPRPPHFVLVLLFVFASSAQAQVGNPVYVDDSPQAWELFQLARAQRADNEGEAVRVYQGLLEDYGDRLIPRRDEATDDFVSVRQRVLADLQEEDALLDRYRLLETAEAARQLALGQVEDVARTRSLTSPGLEALLRATQHGVETAQFRAAASWLREAKAHPDFEGRFAAHGWLFEGTIACFADDAGADGTIRRSLEALSTLGEDGAECAIALRNIADDRQTETLVPPRRFGATTFDHSDAELLDDIVGQTIWSVPLGDKEEVGTLGRDIALPTDRMTDSAFPTVAATVAGSTVYLNEGFRVHALDRFTGRTLWTREYLNRPRFSLDPGWAAYGDLNIVAVEGNHLVTLTGHALPTERSGDGHVICLDTENGDLLWHQNLRQPGGDVEHDGLFPFGSPVISEGRVFLLARKVTQQITGCYVVALDLETGAVDGVRHIASSGSKARSARPFGNLALHEGDLYISSAVGAIARVDASRGDIHWVRRMPVPVNLRDESRRPWEMGGPIIIDDQLITLSPGQDRIVVLDRLSGDERSSHDAVDPSRWGAPTYLLTDGERVYAVGETIRAYDLDDFDGKPRWQLPAITVPENAGPGFVAATENLTLSGRVHLAGASLVVPTLRGALMVNSDTGEVEHRLAVNSIGNPVTADAQLLLATSNGLDVYMSMDRAEQMLRRRIAQEPDDPSAAISLVQIGVRVDDLDVTINAAELALEAIDRAPSTMVGARQELFDILLEVHDDSLENGRDRGAPLYAMLERVARTPPQRVEHLLARGEREAQDDPARAMATYLALLADPVLAVTPRREWDLTRRTSDWVRERLAELTADDGRILLASMERAARTALDERLGDPTTSEGDLLNVTDRFPLTDAGLEATLVASRRRADENDADGALAVLVGALARRPASEQRGALLSPLIAQALRSGRDGAAIAVLRHLAENTPSIDLDRDGVPISPRAWLQAIGVAETAWQRARVGHEPGVARTRPGAILAVPTDRPDCALLREENNLVLVEASDFSSRWSIPFDAEDARPLVFDEDELLIWIDTLSDRTTIISIDPRSGELNWQSDPLRDHLPIGIARERSVTSTLPNGVGFDPREVLVTYDHDRIYLVQRTGGMLAVDRATGEPAWVIDHTLDEVHLGEAHPMGVVLTGVEHSGRRRRNGGDPKVFVIDGRRGIVRHRLDVNDPDGVVWMRTDPLGGVLLATGSELERLDIVNGRRLWSNRSPVVRGSRGGWPVGDDRLIVESERSSLFTVDLRRGLVSEPFDIVVRGADLETPIDADSIDGDLLVRYQRRVVRLDSSGEVLGADVIEEPRDYQAVLLGEEHIVILSVFDTVQQSRAADARRRRTVRTYRVYVLSPNGRLEGDVIELPPFERRIRSATLLDGWLLLATTSETCAVPLSY